MREGMAEGPPPGQPKEQHAHRRVVGIMVALAVPALILAAFATFAPAADAQTRRGAGAGAKPATAKGSAKGDAGSLGPGVLAAPVAAAAPTVAGASTDAGVVEAKTLDGGTHVFKFSELDIEGRLKSPQLVYFLRRVRAEFAAGELGHRSFMREMAETRKEPTF